MPRGPTRVQIRCAVAVAAVLALLPPPARAEQRTVNFYNWSNYMAPGVLEDFTRKTGIKVVYDTFDANETLETRLLAGKSGYDVVVPTAYFLQRQIKAGVFQKLDKSKLPNLANAWPVVTQRLAAYDPGNQYAANYMWGTTGIGYNVKSVQKILGSDAGIVDSEPLRHHRPDVDEVRQFRLVELPENTGLDLALQEISRGHDNIVARFSSEQPCFQCLIGVERVVDDLDSGFPGEVLKHPRRHIV